jgi:hypothetical protein
MITLRHAYHRDDDVLEVHGTDDQGSDVSAFGWISATTNYFPPSDYNPDGSRVDAAQPRPMTSDELRAYCQQLLDDTVPPAPPASDPTITF